MKRSHRKWSRQTIISSSLIAGMLLSMTGLPSYAAAETTPSSTQVLHSSNPQTTTTSTASPTLTAKSVEQFADSYFARNDVKDKLTGALFVVVKDGEVLLNKGYGYSDISTKQPIDPDTTLFRIASISKLFTTTAVMQLAEQGKIDLDRDISEYMNGAVIPNQTGTPLTMKNLMTHTTGYDYTDYLGNKSGVSLQDFVKNNLPTVQTKPGEAYRYDNLAFVHQGYIVENVAKTDFNRYVKQNIFEPLGMNHSDFALSPQVKENLAKTYDGSGKEIPVYTNYPDIDPSGSMFSTGSDIANYMLAMLNGGKLGKTSILEEKSVKTMMASHYTIDDILPVISYAFEPFYQEHHNGQTVIGKGGDLPGFHSWLWMIPEQKVGAMIIVNGEALDPRVELFAAFMDQFYPSQHKDTPITSSAEKLAKFAGDYQNLRLPFLSTNVQVGEDGTLIITDGQGTHKLKQLKDGVFQDEEGKKAGFYQDKDGNITYLYYTSPDSFLKKLNEPAPYHDVAKDSPYEPNITLLNKLNFLANDSTNTFQPELAMTRAEFAQLLMNVVGVQPSNEPVKYSDAVGHKLAKEIQSLSLYAGLQGTEDGKFEPDRAITRQEAASMLFKLISSNVSIPALPEVKLTGTLPAPWALEGVQFVSTLQLLGPEVKVDAEGAVDYKPTQPLLRQEAAAMIGTFVQVFQALM